MRLLLIEDDQDLVKELVPALNNAGFVVETADNGLDGSFLGFEEEFDVVILDLGLPEMNGMEVLRQWRSEHRSMPVLILTARDAWHERVDGLKAGADDYLGKPFHSDELIARLQAITRRQGGNAANTLEWNGVELDIDNQQVIFPDKTLLCLTNIEFRLLQHLMMNPNRIISKSELSEHVYQEEQIADSNVIEVYINRLRHHLGKDFIETRRRQGYRLRAPG